MPSELNRESPTDCLSCLDPGTGERNPQVANILAEGRNSHPATNDFPRLGQFANGLQVMKFSELLNECAFRNK